MTTWFLPEHTIGLYDGATDCRPTSLSSIFETTYEEVLGDQLTAPEITVRSDESVQIDINPLPSDIDAPTWDNKLFARTAYERTQPPNQPLREAKWTRLSSIYRKPAPETVVTLHLEAGGSVTVPPSQKIPQVTTGGVLEQYVKAENFTSGAVVPLQNSLQPSDVQTEEVSNIEEVPYTEYRDENLSEDAGKYMYGADFPSDTLSVSGVFLKS